MDRNTGGQKFAGNAVVALRKESVDRNKFNIGGDSEEKRVALRKESVDRNRCTGLGRSPLQASLSARRAWIEI